MQRSALSIAAFVLLIATVVPSSEARDPVGQAEGILHERAGQAQSQAGQTADDTQRQVDDMSSRGQDAAAREQKGAQDTGNQALFDAEGLAIFLLDVGGRFVDGVVGTVNDILSHVTEFTRFNRGNDPNGGFSAQSTDAVIAREGLVTPLIWIAASAGGLVALVFVVRRLVGLGLIPLLSRISHDEIYNNDARRTIHELVVGEPGQCLNDLVERTGYSRNAVSYHLFVLEKEEEIVSVKDGKYRRYFCRNGKYVNGAKNVVAALRNETTLKLARAVLARPGSIQRDLCVELGATPSATCWHAKRLLDLGVIRKERVANTVKYFPGDAVAKYDLSDMGLGASPMPQPAALA